MCFAFFNLSGEDRWEGYTNNAGGMDSPAIYTWWVPLEWKQKLERYRLETLQKIDKGGGGYDNEARNCSALIVSHPPPFFKWLPATILVMRDTVPFAEASPSSILCVNIKRKPQRMLDSGYMAQYEERLFCSKAFFLTCITNCILAFAWMLSQN
jgi:hypothetical protein